MYIRRGQSSVEVGRSRARTIVTRQGVLRIEAAGLEARSRWGGARAAQPLRAELTYPGGPRHSVLIVDATVRALAIIASAGAAVAAVCFGLERTIAHFRRERGTPHG